MIVDVLAPNNYIFIGTSRRSTDSPPKKLTQTNHHFITPYSVNVCELNLHIKKNLESDSCILFNCIAVLIISL